MEITEISLGGAVALLILREVFGFLLNRRNSSALLKREADNEIVLQKVTDLWNWHNVRGADNVPVWYFRSSLDDAMDTIMKDKFSKIPVYKNSIDNIKGILYAKDF